MTRLIVITFTALGWCFYVMSGGPDFEPAACVPSNPFVLQPPQSNAETIAPAPAEELVTRVAARVPIASVKFERPPAG